MRGPTNKATSHKCTPPHRRPSLLGPGLHFLSGTPPGPLMRGDAPPYLAFHLDPSFPAAPTSSRNLVSSAANAGCLLPSPLSYLARPVKRGTFAEEPSPRSVSKALPRQFTLLAGLLEELKLRAARVHPSWGRTNLAREWLGHRRTTFPSSQYGRRSRS